MDKIGNFTIRDMTVSGFKCFSEEQNFEFGDVTYITGDNHIGKTSIADAIAFALCGRLYNGSAAMDRLYSDGGKKLRVALRLIDAEGKSIDLVRERVDDKVAITLNGYNIRQKDVDVIFGESEVFLSIFNPTFFIEYMGNDGQTLLQKYLPQVAQETVLANMSQAQRALLEKESLLSPETFINRQREKIKDYKESIISLEGKKDLLMRQNMEGKQDLAMLGQRKESLAGQIAALQEKRGQGVNMAELKQQYTDLLLRIDEATADNKAENTPPDASRLPQLELNIKRANAALEEIIGKQYVSKFTDEITKTQGELQVIRTEYRGKEAAFNNVRAGVECPVCCRPITEEVLDSTRAGIEDSMKAITLRGVEKNTQLAQLRELDQKAKDVFDKWKADDTEKHRQRVAELEARRTEIITAPAAESDASLAELIRQRKTLEEAIDLGGLTAEEKISLDTLEAELAIVSSDFEARKAILGRSAPDIDGQTAELEALIKQKEALIAAALDYLSARNELTFQGLPLNMVGFSLYDILKGTGEVKNAFRFTYGGRDYRKLSHSEKIFAGMEVSELMKSLTGRNYPVFVDDSESIVKLSKRPSGQTFLSRVVGGSPLTVVYKDARPAQEQELKKAS
jgi:DNA repair exonuclease SbcCD ATPase subunit